MLVARKRGAVAVRFTRPPGTPASSNAPSTSVVARRTERSSKPNHCPGSFARTTAPSTGFASGPTTRPRTIAPRRSVAVTSVQLPGRAFSTGCSSAARCSGSTANVIRPPAGNARNSNTRSARFAERVTSRAGSKPPAIGFCTAGRSTATASSSSSGASPSAGSSTRTRTAAPHSGRSTIASATRARSSSRASCRNW